MSDQENPILRHFQIVRPQLWDAPEFEKVAFILSHVTRKGANADWDDITDALAELIPEKREFWLRVQATWNMQFLEGMTHMFEHPEISDHECTVIAAAIAVEEGGEK